MSGWIRHVGNKGFNAIEVMMAAGAAVVLAGAALPAVLSMNESARLDGAVQKIVGDITHSQSLAVSKGGCIGLHFGSDPLVNRSNAYRIERGGCDGVGWPAPSDTTRNNPGVVTDWFNPAEEFPGVTITFSRGRSHGSVNGLVFNSRGSSINPFGGAPAHPLMLIVRNSGGDTRTIQVRGTGNVRVQ